MKKNPLIYFISGSIRSISDQKEIVDNVKKIENETFLYEYIESIARAKKISNSEGGIIAAVFGAAKWSNNLKYARLNEYFLKNGKISSEADKFLEEIQKADGFIFSTPVYFGDRSSLMHDFIRLCEEKKVDFSGKVCGFISVGAKRNGGQETTNIYAIHNFTELGALVVGNGPPTSQFGGTCVGGEMGTMDNDYFGIITSVGVGTKVAQVAKMIAAGREAKKHKKAVIDIWILEDENSRIKNYAQEFAKKMAESDKDCEFKILDLTKHNFSRCFGCSICPFEKDDSVAYKCVNKSDDMKELHRRLVSSDGIIVAGLSLEDVSKKDTVYQRFIERTRYIRRDNFLLTNKLVMALSLNDLSANSLFNVRVLSSFIRHNTVFHKGFEEYIFGGKVVADRSEEFYGILKSFVYYSKVLKHGRENVNIGDQKYGEISF